MGMAGALIVGLLLLVALLAPALSPTRRMPSITARF